MKNEKKNYAQKNSNLIPDLPEVPSISNIDTLELADLANSFPFADTLESEPQDVLDIPSFSGLDMLDMESAAQIIKDLEEENTQQEIFPELPVFSSEETDFAQEALPFDISELNPVNLPTIPSFSDEEEASPETENLPEISSFFMFDKEKSKTESDIPDFPDEAFSGVLSDADKEILPQIPSVLDLHEMNLFSMPGNMQDASTLLDEEAEYLLAIPSVDDWMEQNQEEESSEFEEETEILLEPVTEEMLAEEEVIYIDEMPLSVKAKNGLLRIHIRNSRQLVMTGEELLKSIPYMDEKTFQEIRRFQQDKRNPVFPSVKSVSKEIRAYLDEFLEELAPLQISQPRQRGLVLYLADALPEKNRTKENCFLTWYKEQHVRYLLDGYITRLIRNRQMSGLSEDMLQDDMPASMDKKILSEILQEMIDSDRIHKTRGNYYILKYPTVIEFLIENTEEKEQHIDVIRMRMQGCTLSEIAKKLSCSKDHAAKIHNKLLRLVQKLCLINSTSVYEERFRPLFERYNLSREIFTALTKEPPEVYQYLSMVSVAGSAQPEEMKYDFGVPDWIRAAWKHYQEQNS